MQRLLTVAAGGRIHADQHQAVVELGDWRCLEGRLDEVRETATPRQRQLIDRTNLRYRPTSDVRSAKSTAPKRPLASGAAQAGRHALQQEYVAEFDVFKYWDNFCNRSRCHPRRAATRPIRSLAHRISERIH